MDKLSTFYVIVVVFCCIGMIGVAAASVAMDHSDNISSLINPRQIIYTVE